MRLVVEKWWPDDCEYPAKVDIYCAEYESPIAFRDELLKRARKCVDDVQDASRRNDQAYYQFGRGSKEHFAALDELRRCQKATNISLGGGVWEAGYFDDDDFTVYALDEWFDFRLKNRIST